MVVTTGLVVATAVVVLAVVAAAVVVVATGLLVVLSVPQPITRNEKTNRMTSKTKLFSLIPPYYFDNDTCNLFDKTMSPVFRIPKR